MDDTAKDSAVEVDALEMSIQRLRNELKAQSDLEIALKRQLAESTELKLAMEQRRPNHQPPSQLLEKDAELKLQWRRFEEIAAKFEALASRVTESHPSHRALRKRLDQEAEKLQTQAAASVRRLGSEIDILQKSIADARNQASQLEDRIAELAANRSAKTEDKRKTGEASTTTAGKTSESRVKVVEPGPIDKQIKNPSRPMETKPRPRNQRL